ncbi:MAG: YceI family protein [Deltaproteobacteria bacterium]|nr:YceI family protein [Deltaproteobacteria bacterium]
MISCTVASATRFDFRDAIQRNVLVFSSDASLEKIVGTNHAITGWVEVDPENLAAGVSGAIEADMRAFQAGSEMLDEFVRDKMLNSSEFPYSAFTIKRLFVPTGSKLVDGVPLQFRAEGDLQLRGQSKPLALRMKATYFKESEITKQRGNGNLLKLSATFELDILDFQVPWPDAWRNKIARKIQVSADLLGTTAPPPVKIPILDTKKK